MIISVLKPNKRQKTQFALFVRDDGRSDEKSQFRASLQLEAKLDELQGQTLLDEVNGLLWSLWARQAAFTRTHPHRDTVIQAHFVISKLIAKKL